MKKALLFATALCGSGLLTDASAQELIRTSLPKEVYSPSKNFELRNRQKVNEVYRELKEVYTLDFSKANTKSVLPAIGQAASQLVAKAGYVDYSNQKAIGDLLSIRPEALSVHIPFEGDILVLDLVQASLFGDGFRVQSNDPSKVQDITLGVYYQGTIRGTNSLVGMSFFDREFTLLISRDTDQDRTIESGLVRTAENTSGTHIIYSDDDLKVNISHSCQAEELEQYQQAVEQLSLQPVPFDQEKATFKCVTYFWETAYNLYTSKGSTQAVTNYMTSVFNNFQLMNNNEQIGSKLNQLYIWTTADSYNNSLDNFSANRSNFGANLATLFSTTGGGGVAWLDQICGSNEYYKHGFCGSMGEPVPGIPNYSWPVNVTTHEIGHNLGSPHTHACSWTGGAIDGCGPAAGYSEGCNGPIPSNGGTIMSYCHLNSVGMNFTLGFGTQPGNLIRSRVNSCISLTCDSGTGGGQTCTNAYEPNETQSAAATLTSGTAVSAAIAAAGDVDYYKITTSTTTNNVFTLSLPSGVDFDLTIYNSAGTQIGSSAGTTTTETVTLNGQAAGTYYAKVYGYNNAFSATCYTFTATATAVTNCSTAYEPNNSASAAASIPLSTTISAAISSSTDQDYYAVNVSTAGTHVFSLAGPSGVDYDLYIYNSAGTTLGSGTGSTATESVTLNSLAAGTYTVRVFGYNGANSATCYTLNVARTGASVASAGSTGETTYSIYPNPVKDKLAIAASDSDAKLKVEIRDINGKVLSGQELMSGATVDVSDLSSGIYFVRIASGVSEPVQLKFVKE
jgi:hypothetical protein